jgi:hypothetical protein
MRALRNKIILAIIILVFSVQNLKSQEYEQPTDKFYTYWAIMLTSNYNSNSVDNWLKPYEIESRTKYGFELFGLYFPIDHHHTLVGFVYNQAKESIFWQQVTDLKYLLDFSGTSPGHIDYEVSIKQSLYSISVFHFFSNYIGDGPFLRGDIGYARMVMDDPYLKRYVSEDGIGVFVGGGVMVPYSFLHFVLSANYSYRYYKSGANSLLGLSVGLLL